MISFTAWMRGDSEASTMRMSIGKITSPLHEDAPQQRSSNHGEMKRPARLGRDILN